MSPTIRPARLVSRRAHLIPGQLHVTELFFEVPLDHGDPAAGTIRLFGRLVNKHERPAGTPAVPDPTDEPASQKPYMVYLEGGPGFGNRDPQDHPLTRPVLARGYQMLYLDYRGTGLSTPINADAVVRRGGPRDQAAYLRLFRQDRIVHDLEAVRLCLTADLPADRRAWSSFGQSFGGFVTLTYLSFFPDGLRECFVTGGLAPVAKTADDVYRATYQKVRERNRAYYAKYPEDVEAVWRVARYVEDEGAKQGRTVEKEGSRGEPGIELPDGGRLTVSRLLSLGLAFGTHGGLDTVHSLVLKMTADLDQFGFLTRASLAALQQNLGLDANPVYAVLHEAIYCSGPGVASRWAAHRAAADLPEFAWVRSGRLPDEPASSSSFSSAPLFFTGEMILPQHFDAFAELIPLRDAADLLADYDAWEPLYDEAQLRRNEVPVYAASYVEDMFVEAGLARETAALVGGVRVFETNVLYHNAVRVRTEEIMQQLFALRDDPVD